MPDSDITARIARLEAFRNSSEGAVEIDGEPTVCEATGLLLSDLDAAIKALRAYADAVPIAVIEDLNDFAKR